jgi:signal transduction histidine kinase
LKKDEFSIGDLLSDIYSSLEKKAQDKKVNLTIECEEPQIQVYADIAKIERVIQNLVENAIRYSDEGETVILRAIKEKDNTIQLVIKDTGSGIATEHLPYIFEPYYRASDEYKLKHKGAGLGLAISQRLLALHDVTLNVKSNVNKGTTFYFNLPCI